MTCIVGLVDNDDGTVFMGGDSCSSNGSNSFVLKNSKVFENGDFIIGCTASFRMIQILMFSFQPPHVGDKEIMKYMCTDFINSVRECFRDNGFLQKTADGDDAGGVFLVAYKNRLFRVEGDFQVSENLNGIDAIGCGQDFALGSLYESSNKGIPCNDRVLNSLKAAEFLSVGVRSPFVIMDTKFGIPF